MAENTTNNSTTQPQFANKRLTVAQQAHMQLLIAQRDAAINNVADYLLTLRLEHGANAADGWKLEDASVGFVKPVAE